VINAAAWTEQAERVLTPGAVSLIASLHSALQEERQELLRARGERQRSFDEGAVPEYLEGDAAERARGDWTVAPLPDDLLLG
jgi:malate synthase